MTQKFLLILIEKTQLNKFLFFIFNPLYIKMVKKKKKTQRKAKVLKCQYGRQQYKNVIDDDHEKFFLECKKQRLFEYKTLFTKVQI